MKTTYRIKTLALALAVTLGSGCATVEQAKYQNRVTADITRQQIQTMQPQANNSVFEVKEGFTAAAKPLAVSQVDPSKQLPDAFFKEASVEVLVPVSLSEIVARISAATKYRIFVEPDVEGEEGKSRSAAPSASTAAAGAGAAAAPGALVPALPPATPPANLPPIPGLAGAPIVTPQPVAALPQVALNDTGKDLVLPDFIYEGNLAGMLDEATARLGLSWRWTGNRVEIFRYETRIFRLDAIAGKLEGSSSIDTKSGGSGGGSGGVQGKTGQSSSFDFQVEIWKEVEGVLKEMISENGKVITAPTAGQVIVRDTPRNLDRIGKQMKQFNDIFSREVVLQVEVYAVDIDQGQETTANWVVEWANALRGLGVSLGSAGANGSGFTIVNTDTSSPFSGSGLALNALNNYGNTSRVTSASVRTSHGQAVPFNVARTVAYIQSRSTSVTGTTGLATETITPGEVSEGFSFTVMPQIKENNLVNLRFALDLSEIENIASIGTVNNIVQLPEIASRNTAQNIQASSGETIVLTGFEQASASFDRSASLSNFGRGAEKGSRSFVIMITPWVLE